MEDQLNSLISPAKSFHSERGAQYALRALTDGNYKPLFLSQLVALKTGANHDCPFWSTDIATPDSVMKGRTKGGLDVLVIAHVPNYFSNPDNLNRAVQEGLINGYGSIPVAEFHRTLDLEEKEKVIVLAGNKYDEFISAPEGDLSELGYLSPGDYLAACSILTHPAPTPFIGERSKARNYILAHKKIFGNHFGIWHKLPDSDKPIGGLLHLGSSGNNSIGIHALDSETRFIGVPGRTEYALPPS
ncbi:MAG: hypothetical protein AABX51_03915 [Nanoarchaeota archaeon]